MASASSEAVIPSHLVYLYEHLLYRFSSEGFQDKWNIGGFVVIFIFCTVTLAFMLAVLFSWCCSCCFRDHIPLNKVGIMILPTSSGTSLLPKQGPERSTVASQTTPVECIVNTLPAPGCKPAKMRPRKICPADIRAKQKPPPYRGVPDTPV